MSERRLSSGAEVPRLVGIPVMFIFVYCHGYVCRGRVVSKTPLIASTDRIRSDRREQVKEKEFT